MNMEFQKKYSQWRASQQMEYMPRYPPSSAQVDQRKEPPRLFQFKKRITST